MTFFHETFIMRKKYNEAYENLINVAIFPQNL
jgi:hypothetical protein